MSVPSFAPGDKFVLRILKHLATNPDNVWANSYEFVTTDAGGVEELLAMGDIFFNFEKQIHCDIVQFDRYIISTWEPDSVPYDPESFVTIPVTGTGVRSDVPNEVVPLGEAWRVNRQATTGRFGNLFYRGCLFENEVSQPAGKPVLTVPADNALILSDAITDSLLDQYLGTSGPGGMYLALINFNGTQTRPVTQLVSAGVTLIKADHMWFNRTASPS